MANQPRKILACPHAGHRNRIARHTNRARDCEWRAAPGWSMVVGGGFSIRLSVPKRPHDGYSRDLSRGYAADNVLAMQGISRMLQLAALVILPLSIMAQLSERISLGQMLQFMVVGICLFSIGYLLQTYSGKGK
jgi:hypothetical protein